MTGIDLERAREIERWYAEEVVAREEREKEHRGNLMHVIADFTFGTVHYAEKKG